MKRCLVCDAHYTPSLSHCPKCQFSPKKVDGFYAYAPNYSHNGGGFKAHYFSELAQLEESSFWFRSRNQLVIWALKKYCPNFDSLLEIGCGTGFVLTGISNAFPNSTLHGSEIFTAGLDFSAERLPNVQFYQMDARNIPYYEEYDVVCAFDVLEHIEEDRRVLEQMYSALKPGGHIIVTIPQHAWLWSASDEYACHVRRYKETDIIQKITETGFQVVRSTSFVTILLPAMMISRLINEKSNLDEYNATAELRLSPWLDALFFRLLQTEKLLIKIGFDYPVGGSRLVVAKKV